MVVGQPETLDTSYKSCIPHVTCFHLKSIFDSWRITLLSDMVSPGCKIGKHYKGPLRMNEVMFFIGD